MLTELDNLDLAIRVAFKAWHKGLQRRSRTTWYVRDVYSCGQGETIMVRIVCQQITGLRRVWVWDGERNVIHSIDPQRDKARERNLA